MLVTLRVLDKRNLYKQGYPINLDDTEVTVIHSQNFSIRKYQVTHFLKGSPTG